MRQITIQCLRAFGDALDGVVAEMVAVGVFIAAVIPTIGLTHLSCHSFRNNAVRLQLLSLAYNLSNFLQTLALSETAEHWSVTTLREKLVKIGAKVVRHGRYAKFQLAEFAIPRALFSEVQRLIDGLRPYPLPL